MLQHPSEPETDIRLFQLDDLPQVTALYCEVFNGAPWNDRWTDDTASRRLTDALDTPGSLGLLLWEGTRLIGGIIGHQEHWFNGSSFFIQEMFVHPGEQRSGYGSQLMDRLKVMLSEQDVGHLFLTTSRVGATAEFYGKHGFRASQRMVLMTCHLEQN